MTISRLDPDDVWPFEIPQNVIIVCIYKFALEKLRSAQEILAIHHAPPLLEICAFCQDRLLCSPHIHHPQPTQNGYPQRRRR